MPVKDAEEAYEKIIEISNNNDYTAGNLLNFAYFKNHYKLIAVGLSKQTKLKDPQPTTNWKAVKNTGATFLFIVEKSEETTFKFSRNSVTII